MSSLFTVEPVLKAILITTFFHLQLLPYFTHIITHALRSITTGYPQEKNNNNYPKSSNNFTPPHFKKSPTNTPLIRSIPLSPIQQPQNLNSIFTDPAIV